MLDQVLQKLVSRSSVASRHNDLEMQNFKRLRTDLAMLDQTLPWAFHQLSR